jgi:predicted dinucleotide-binding enzyme
MMNVGMIGAGNVGRSLTKASTKAGHSVSISATSRDEAETVSSEVGGRAVGSNREAGVNADVVILAVPFDAVEGIVRELGNGLVGKLVVDVTNKFDPMQLNGPSSAERTQKMAPNARMARRSTRSSRPSSPTRRSTASCSTASSRLTTATRSRR